jgi:hypothetical protein
MHRDLQGAARVAITDLRRNSMLKINLITLAIVLAMTAPQAHAQTGGSNQVPTGLSGSSDGLDMVGVPGCHFGEKIDTSTAADATRFLKSAGYTSITGLKKSCDNNWHGQAVLNGVPANVMVTPEGRVMQEGS